MRQQEQPIWRYMSGNTPVIWSAHIVHLRLLILNIWRGILGSIMEARWNAHIVRLRRHIMEVWRDIARGILKYVEVLYIKPYIEIFNISLSQDLTYECIHVLWYKNYTFVYVTVVCLNQYYSLSYLTLKHFSLLYFISPLLKKLMHLRLNFFFQFITFYDDHYGFLTNVTTAYGNLKFMEEM